MINYFAKSELDLETKKSNSLLVYVVYS